MSGPTELPVPDTADVRTGPEVSEELLPGFSFTTFSYALSLLRPDIIQELNLVEHGFIRVQATITENSSKDERIELIERTLRGLRTY